MIAGDPVRAALALRAGGRLEEALALLAPHREAETIAPRLALGGLLAEAGRHAEAEACLAAAARRWPESAAAAFNLAKVVRERGRAEEAVALYRRALDLDPGLVAGWRNCGNLLVDLGRPAEAVECWDRVALIRRAPGAPAGDDPDLVATSRAKLRHDAEQLEHLVARGVEPERFAAIAAAWRGLLARLPPGPDHALLPAGARELGEFASSYNRLLHRPAAPALAGGALSPSIDWRDVERRYRERAPGIAVVDGLLREEALAALRDYCLDATVWFGFRYANGYVRASMEDGFSAPLLLQIADELRRAAPAIFRHHTLRKHWAFKYDSALAGIPAHADFAAINVNFWITPDEANLDPERGGLVLWDKEAPRDWDFRRYNADNAAIARFLRESGATMLRVPHRRNRALLFNSDLFHATDDLRFAPGYANRRINVTMLYGRREDAPDTG